ncbi:MAG: type III pantothenate kinase [Chitinophagaceae bacterium]|nr:MAG: type III pantothenate kinase [Chitinophagaceae bacterium]
MAITFCFDYGNTRRKLAVFDGDRIVDVQVLEDDDIGRLEQLAAQWKPEKSILSSVIEHDPAIEDYLASTTRFHKLSHLTRVRMTTPVGKPETIGADRLALTEAAIHFHPGKNNFVIALGTCVTYNFINKYGEFTGGGISPGLMMRLKSLNHYTAKLPVIQPSSNAPLIGYDTASNILSGAILGMSYEIDGFIDSYARKFDNFNVLLTGGDIVHLASHLKNRIFADPELLFKGLYAISQVNNA